jgi:serine/threonine protein phosphatase PrpC
MVPALLLLTPSKDMAITITVNHTPKNQQERERIEKLGSKVVKDRLTHPALNPEMFNVALSRSIGNSYFKSKKYIGDNHAALIAEPWVDEVELTDSVKFMVLATDGLWDTITPDEAVGFVWANKTLDPNEICRLLVSLSRKKGSKDNITTILVFFCNPKTDLKEEVKPVVL